MFCTSYHKALTKTFFMTYFVNIQLRFAQIANFSFCLRCCVTISASFGCDYDLWKVINNSGTLRALVVMLLPRWASHHESAAGENEVHESARLKLGMFMEIMAFGAHKSRAIDCKTREKSFMIPISTSSRSQAFTKFLVRFILINWIDRQRNIGNWKLSSCSESQTSEAGEKRKVIAVTSINWVFNEVFSGWRREWRVEDSNSIQSKSNC